MAAHIPQWSVGAMSGATAAATLGAAAAAAARVRSDAPRIVALLVDSVNVVVVADDTAAAAVNLNARGVAARGRAGGVAVAAATGRLPRR